MSKTCDDLSVLPSIGSVLGVDVGYSEKRRSSAVCRLDWDERQIVWATRRFQAVRADREEAIIGVSGGRRLEAAAFDGPLQAGFQAIGRYRVAERMLTGRFQRKIGKPGQANAPVGKRLNAAANDCVRVVLSTCEIARATHCTRIDERAVAEAFPTAFLGVMLRDPTALAARRDNRSDLFFQYLAASGALQRLMVHLLPSRSLAMSLDDVTNHDDRAALVCALTALSLVAGDFTAVGDADGWIILPPRLFVRSWARADLEANAREEEHTGCYHQSKRKAGGVDLVNLC
jgi:hypothetical protein